ncbi:hypothetical protein SMICM304S_08389 [Streptomyces microflavus]
MTYGTPAGIRSRYREETTHNPLMSGASSRALAWIAAGLQATPRFQ